jgi:hypothetical protein
MRNAMMGIFNDLNKSYLSVKIVDKSDENNYDLKKKSKYNQKEIEKLKLIFEKEKEAELKDINDGWEIMKNKKNEKKDNFNDVSINFNNLNSIDNLIDNNENEDDFYYFDDLRLVPSNHLNNNNNYKFQFNNLFNSFHTNIITMDFHGMFVKEVHFILISLFLTWKRKCEKEEDENDDGYSSQLTVPIPKTLILICGKGLHDEHNYNHKFNYVTSRMSKLGDFITRFLTVFLYFFFF